MAEEARVLPLRCSAVGAPERTLEDQEDWRLTGRRSSEKEARTLELNQERFRTLIMGGYTWWGLGEHKDI